MWETEGRGCDVQRGILGGGGSDERPGGPHKFCHLAQSSFLGCRGNSPPKGCWRSHKGGTLQAIVQGMEKLGLGVPDHLCVSSRSLVLSGWRTAPEVPRPTLLRECWGPAWVYRRWFSKPGISCWLCVHMCDCVYVCECARVCARTCSVIQLCLTLQPHGRKPTRLLCSWNIRRARIFVEWFLLQEIFLTQRSNLSLLCLLRCRRLLYSLCCLGSHQECSSTSAARWGECSRCSKGSLRFVLPQADSSLLTGISTPSVTLSVLELSSFLFSLPRRVSQPCPPIRHTRYPFP